ncbi:MAG: hypothetical protein ACJ77B_03820 [Chloroflexota bacterium]
MANGTSQGTAMLHCYPQDDDRLRQTAEQLLHGSALDDPRELERQLRTSWPNVVVRSQHPLAMMAGEQAIWYVFRDGSFVGEAAD